MSAWIVSKRHIDALVTGLVEAGMVRASLVNSTGAMLWAENYTSVNARYRENDSTPSYHHTPLHVDQATLSKVLRCYRYQSCEHDGWSTSKACTLVEKLLATIDTSTPGFQAVYDAAPWGL